MYIAIQNAQINDADVRIAWHDGLPHVVAPVVAVQEQILKGELLPRTEIAASAASFSGRPLPVGHPTDDDGNFRSANDAETWDEEVVGKMFDAEESDGKLLGNVWVNVTKSVHLGVEKAARYAGPLALLAQHLDGGIAALGFDDGDSDPINDDDGDAQQVRLPDKIIEALEKLADELGGSDPESDDAETANAAGALEVSTAYWYQSDGVSGTHDGEEYSASQLNVKPDHLALLPTAIGECSVKDGCGAPRANESGGSQVLMADGGQPTNAPSNGGETEFAFASDETKDGETVGDDGGSDSGDGDPDDPPENDDAGNDSSGWFDGVKSRFPFLGSNDDGDFEIGELEGGADCGCDHGNENMENEEIARLMGLSVEQFEKLDDAQKANMEVAAQAKATFEDDDTGGDGSGGDGGDDGGDPGGDGSGGGDGTGDGDGDGSDDTDDDPDDTANSGLTFESEDELRDFVNDEIQNHEERDAKRDVARDVATLDPDLEANEDTVSELMENTRTMLERQRTLFEGMGMGDDSPSGWGDFGGNGGGGGGNGGGGNSPGSNPFGARVLGSQSSEDGGNEGWNSDESISGQHSLEAMTDGGESEDE